MYQFCTNEAILPNFTCRVCTGKFGISRLFINGSVKNTLFAID